MVSKKSMGGRPTAYRPEYAGQAQKLCANNGAIDRELADFFNVSISTIKNWKARYPAFLSATIKGKDPADQQVADSLYHRAMGYTYDAVKIFHYQGAIIEVPYREHVPPDTTAAIFWLKNRRPDVWRDVHRQEHSGPGGGPIEARTSFDLSRLTDEELTVLNVLTQKAQKE